MFQVGDRVTWIEAFESRCIQNPKRFIGGRVLEVDERYGYIHVFFPKYEGHEDCLHLSDDELLLRGKFHSFCPKELGLYVKPEGTEKMLDVKLGDVWEDTQGDEVVICEDDGSSYCPFRGLLGNWYTREGNSIAGDRKLVKRLRENPQDFPDVCLVKELSGEGVRLSTEVSKRKAYEVFLKLGEEFKDVKGNVHKAESFSRTGYITFINGMFDVTEIFRMDEAPLAKQGDIVAGPNPYLLSRVSRVKRDYLLLASGQLLSELVDFKEDETLSEWGSVVDIPETTCADDQLEGFIERVFPTSCHLLSARLHAFKPARSGEFEGKIAIYQTRDKLDRNIRTAMKPGRAIRFIFPEMSDKEVENFVNKFRLEMSPRKFTLKTSKEAEAFKHAYSHTQESYEDPHTTSFRKSLANSCMRHSFDNLPLHPCEAYASGDFMMVWTESQSGKIGSRCVVFVNHHSGTWQAGPIYGVCEPSINTICQYLEANGANLEGDWEGARMVQHDYNGGFIAPYLDLVGAFTPDGDYLVIRSNGHVCADDYSGVISSNQYTCNDCGGVRENDLIYVSDGYDICRYCYEENYFTCEASGDVYHIDDSAEVYHISFRGRESIRRVHIDVAESDYVFCEYDDRFWASEDTFTTYDGEHVPKYALTRDGEYFECDESGEIYPISDEVTIRDSSGNMRAVAQENIPEHYIFDEESGEYREKEAA